jgi:hypothetical protein
MTDYNIVISDVFCYRLKIQAKNEKEAIEKAKNYFKNCNDDYTGAASASTHDRTEFNIVKKNNGRVFYEIKEGKDE